MITLAIAKPDVANGTIFNAVSERAVTFNGLVKLCAAAAGKEAEIVYYDPEAIGIDARKSFPFRNMVIHAYIYTHLQDTYTHILCICADLTHEFDVFWFWPAFLCRAKGCQREAGVEEHH